MSGFTSFNGTYRRTPTVSFRGNSKTESREELLERAQKERHKRETDRNQKAAALKIQKHYRGYVIRQKHKQTLRGEFDLIKNSYKKHPTQNKNEAMQIKKSLITQLLTFFEYKHDSSRMLWLCQVMVQERSEFFDAIIADSLLNARQNEVNFCNWPYKIARLITQALTFMASASSQESISSTLRFVEIYSSSESFVKPGGTTDTTRMSEEESHSYSSIKSITKYLMHCNKYFGLVRRLCDKRIPPLLEENSSPPTHLAEAILKMITRPLNFLYSLSKNECEHTIRCALLSLTENFFTTQFTEQVEYFIIPALAKENFPHGQWTAAMNEAINSDKHTPWKDTSSCWLLYSFLKLFSVSKDFKYNMEGGNTSVVNKDSSNLTDNLENYLNVLSHLTGCLLNFGGKLFRGRLYDDNCDDHSDPDSDDENESSTLGGTGYDQDNIMETFDITDESKRVARKGLELLNDKDLVSILVAGTEKKYEQMGSIESKEKSRKIKPYNPAIYRSLCRLCHHLLVLHPLALHKFRLLYTLAFRSAFLHRLWNLILDTKRPSPVASASAAVPLLTVISRGIRTTTDERDEIVPLLTVFSSLFGYLLVTINDTEFYGGGSQVNQQLISSSQRNETLNYNNTIVSKIGINDDAKADTKISKPELSASNTLDSIWMPFTLSELVPMSLSLRDVTIGLVELAFPESRPVVKEEYKQAVMSVRDPTREISDVGVTDTHIWSHLFRTTVLLVRQLYTRDTRRQFCPDNHWINDRITLPLDRTNDVSFHRRSRLRQYRPFQGLRVFTREELVEEGPPLSAKEVRLSTVLRELPYAISFAQRVQVFHNLIQKDKEEHQGDQVNFLQGNSIQVHIRRNFIYEDAFEKLSPENEPNMKLKMRTQLVNVAGLDEAGIDGGGLFREFMTELLKTSFDPNRGFFRLTNDNNLYPNPKVAEIEPRYIPHYFFIGRMLGKALYENMLIELPLASFFLSKLLGQKTINVDIDHLSSLDKELYKNLLYLKTYDGDVTELELDFTVASEEIGKTSVEELKSGGTSIRVTNENRIEYIHLMADYKLNRQIRSQCNAFRQGLSDVINLDWLRMFSHRELQILVSGADREINVRELRASTKYGNGFDDDHHTIGKY